MKNVCLTVLLSSLCFVSTAYADVSLQLPDNLYIVALNGKNKKIHTTASLPDGLNQIAVGYQGEFGRNVDESEIEYSDVFVVTFEAASEQLLLKIFPVSRKRDVEKFNRDPQIRILRKNGLAIEIRVAKLKKEGLQFLRDYEQELLLFNSTNSPAAISIGKSRGGGNTPGAVEPLQTKNTSAEDTSNQSKSSENPGMTPNQQSGSAAGMPDTQESLPAEAMLKYWYQQADEETRERFRKWITRDIQ